MLVGVSSQVNRPLYDGVIFLNTHHKGKLKEEFGKDYFDTLLAYAMLGPLFLLWQLVLEVFMYLKTRRHSSTFLKYFSVTKVTKQKLKYDSSSQSNMFVI